jgi:bifunctional DNA-binding transcriptional regulator/antitoxin component of YhaV-PrlF toxin-antitoxin module
MVNLIVRAQKNGKGIIKPFGTYDKNQAGAMVTIGNKKYKVNKEGKINIPKKIMEEHGIKGKDKRNRIVIKFASGHAQDKNYWKDVSAMIFKPVARYKDYDSYTPVRHNRPFNKNEKRQMENRLRPVDFMERNYSP